MTAALTALATAGCEETTLSAVVLFPSTPVTDADGKTLLDVLPAGAKVEFLGEYSPGIQVRLNDGRTGYIARNKVEVGAWPVAVLAVVELQKGEKIYPPAVLAVVAEHGDAVEFAYGGSDGRIRYGQTRELSHLSAVRNDIRLTGAMLEAQNMQEPRRTATLKKLLTEAGDSELASIIERAVSGEKAPIRYVFPEPFLADDDSL